MDIDFQLARELFDRAGRWMTSETLSKAVTVQAVTIAIALSLGLLASLPFRRKLRDLLATHSPSHALAAKAAALAIALVPQLAMLSALLILNAIAGDHFARRAMIEGAASLMGAFVATRVIGAFVPNKLAAQFVNLVIWLVVFLNVMGLGGPLAAYLDSVSITFGKARISVLTFIKAAVLFLLFFKTGGWISGLLQSRLQRSKDLTPSARALISQTLKVVIMAAAIFIPLNSLGIDLSALTVFSGALGVGLGFGLQKTAGNFISGVILLLDKSIKPGDVIEVGGVYGWITAIHGRYASVLTRDGTCYLIPNEDLITNRVINWSYSGGGVRLKAKIGVAYHTDLRLAMRLMEEAGREHKRVAASPAPAARLMGFGDSSVDFELRFWINDPQNGVVNVKSDVLLSVWDKFKAHDIELPFPQRDVHLSVRGDADASGSLAALRQALEDKPDTGSA